jgi:1,6-anhydro-N-acetylmuramate kinase
MSGTSLDGVDAALVDFTSPPGRLVASHFVPYSDEVRAEALALNASGPDELERAAGLANRLAALYARATAELLARAGARREAVAAIGCHGQTCGIDPSAATRSSLRTPRSSPSAAACAWSPISARVTSPPAARAHRSSRPSTRRALRRQACIA